MGEDAAGGSWEGTLKKDVLEGVAAAEAGPVGAAAVGAGMNAAAQRKEADAALRSAKAEENVARSFQDSLSSSQNSTKVPTSIGGLVVALLFFGVLQYFVSVSDINRPLALGLSLLCVLFGTVITLFSSKDAKLATVLLPFLLLTWYALFKDGNSFAYFGLAFLVLTALLIVVSLRHSGSIGSVISAEANSLFIVLAFFLSTGALAALNQAFPSLSFNLEGTLFGLIILYTPWWFYYAVGVGISLSNSITGFNSKILGFSEFLAILSLLLLVITLPTTVAIDDQLSWLPIDVISAEELQEANAAARESFEAKLPAVELMSIRLQCAFDFSSVGQGQSPKECIAAAELQYELEQYCSDVEGFSSGTSAHSECMEEREEQQGSGSLNGVIDSSLEPVLVTITDTRKTITPTNSLGKKQEVVRSVFLDQLRYTFSVDIENNPEKKFGLAVGCTYSHRKFRGKTVEGVVEYPFASFSNGHLIEGEDFSEQFLCSFPNTLEDLDDFLVDGVYTVEFTATVLDMESETTQERLWVEVNDPFDSTQSRILSDLKHGGNVYGSDQFARLNFDLGGSSALEVDQNVVLQSFIENVGDGEISSIKFYQIEIGDFYSPSGTSDTCMMGQQGDVYLGENNRKYGVSVAQCLVVPDSILASLVASDENNGYYRQTIRAQLVFDYQLSHSLTSPDFEIIEDCEIDGTIDCEEEATDVNEDENEGAEGVV